MRRKSGSIKIDFFIGIWIEPKAFCCCYIGRLGGDEKDLGSRLSSPGLFPNKNSLVFFFAPPA